jgi:flotillin
MAPVDTQITLVKEIGENDGYQTYLITVKQVEASQAVGIELAKAMGNADIEIIANSGDV